MAADREIVIRLSPPAISKLTRVAEETRRTPSEVARDWVIERLTLARASERAVDAKPTSASLATAREALRQKYRPADVVILLVGESAPAGGTFFYQADSHLFNATREAFERALGPMPRGSAFLDRFRDMGFWLYDMADEPVNRKPGRPRKFAVSQGVAALTRLIEELDPDVVLAVKTSLEGPVRKAAGDAGLKPSRLRVLPFPLYQWREEYVRELAAFLHPSGHASPPPLAASQERLTLHEAMLAVLRDEGRAMPARELANKVASRALYERRDGGRADYQQLLLRAKKYPKLFEVSAFGIAIRKD